MKKIEFFLLFIFFLNIAAILIVAEVFSPDYAGSYSTGSNIVKIYPSGMSPEYYHIVCMHEYGHYVWDELMTEEDRKFYNQSEEEYARSWESWERKR